MLPGWLADLLGRVRALLRRATVERELSEEIQFHLDMETEANIRRGMAPAEARRAAALAFGSVERAREEHRDARGTRLLEDAVADLRWAARWLTHSPGFAAAVVLTLALGVGGTTAVVCVVDGVLLRPLPYPEADRLVAVWSLTRGETEPWSSSPPDFRVFRERASAFERLGGYYAAAANLVIDGEPVRLSAAPRDRRDFRRARGPRGDGADFPGRGGDVGPRPGRDPERRGLAEMVRGSPVDRGLLGPRERVPAHRGRRDAGGVPLSRAHGRAVAADGLRPWRRARHPGQLLRVHGGTPATGRERRAGGARAGPDRRRDLGRRTAGADPGGARRPAARADGRHRAASPPAPARRDRAAARHHLRQRRRAGARPGSRARAGARRARGARRHAGPPGAPAPHRGPPAERGRLGGRARGRLGIRAPAADAGPAGISRGSTR